MEQELKNELIAYFQSLPTEVQEAFASLDLDSFLSRNEFAQPLVDWQKDVIINVITLTFLGLSDPAFLSTEIKMLAEIARERADGIARSIERDILVPNMHILEQVFSVQEKTVFPVPGAEGIVQQPQNLKVQQQFGATQPTYSTFSPPQTQNSFTKQVTGNTQTQKTPGMYTPQRPATQPGPVTRGAYDPYQESPSAKTSGADPHPAVPAPHSLEVFRERLTKQVSAPVEQVILAEKKKERPLPPTKEQLAKDPYRETVD